MLRKLATEMRVPLSRILLIAETASHRYKIYRIAKRTGGSREIAHPAIELKSIQRWLVDNVLAKLPVHDAVYSYRKGRSIRDHAEIHKRQNYLIRIDFKDFFPSITARDIALLLREHRNKLPDSVTSEDLRAICKLVCRNGRLTIGAPSSPALSNAVLYSFDKHWALVCSRRKVIYSRYADDIYLSTNEPNLLSALYAEIQSDLADRISPKLTINRKKVVFTSRKHNKNVTGITLTSDRRISIGHKKKRLIRSLVYKFSNGDLQGNEASYLRGYLSYVNSVEPSFIKKLRKKYGSVVIKEVMSTTLVSNKYSKTRKPNSS